MPLSCRVSPAVFFLSFGWGGWDAEGRMNVAQCNETPTVPIWGPEEADGFQRGGEREREGGNKSRGK